MRRKVIVFFIFLIIYFFSTNNNIDNKTDDFKEENQYVSVLNNNNKINNIELEEYVIGVVACEMPASFDNEALKAMAVAARTYALYKMKQNKNYDVTTDTSSQCYITTNQMKSNWKNNYDKYYNKVKNAVEETNGEYMTYNDDIIIAFYFSITNGYTENCENVFSQKLDYLVSVPSSWDKDYSYKKENKKIELKDFLNKLNLIKIDNYKIYRYDTGRVKTIKINNKSYKGTQFRKLFNLKSADFDIDINDSYVIISTKGYGHGVGMSQYGAEAMSNRGYKYDEILKYYYTGIEIMNN